MNDPSCKITPVHDRRSAESKLILVYEKEKNLTNANLKNIHRVLVVVLVLRSDWSSPVSEGLFLRFQSNMHTDIMEAMIGIIIRRSSATK